MSVPEYSSRTGGNFRRNVGNTELFGFWTFPIVRCSWSRNTTFRKLDLFPSSGEWGEKTPTQLGPLERANLKCFHSQEHRTMEKVLKPQKFCVLYTIARILQKGRKVDDVRFFFLAVGRVVLMSGLYNTFISLFECADLSVLMELSLE
jgi:hypothetical protein